MIKDSDLDLLEDDGFSDGSKSKPPKESVEDKKNIELIVPDVALMNQDEQIMVVSNTCSATPPTWPIIYLNHQHVNFD